MLFSFVIVVVCRITWSSFSTCKSCHCTAEGLTFSDPIHKKSAKNLNLYNFCHSAKKLTAVSPFRRCPFFENIFFEKFEKFKSVFRKIVFGSKRPLLLYNMTLCPKSIKKGQIRTDLAKTFHFGKYYFNKLQLNFEK
jgi:hypothetical protein